MRTRPIVGDGVAWWRRRWMVWPALSTVALFAGFWIVFVTLRGTTPPVHDPAGRPLPRAIAVLETVPLGDADQWVLIRGADRTAPIMLFLHGGPGMPAMYLAHAFQRDIERDFLMVHWDRRGAGKSWSAREPLDSLTVRRTLGDLFELTAWLRGRFGQDRIYLVAHSWGTYLGLLAISEHPEWYHAYIGMGQLTPDRGEARETQRLGVIAAAKAQGDTALAEDMDTSGRRPTESDVFHVHGELAGATSMWPLIRTGLMAPEYTLLDAANVRRGSQLLWRTLAADTNAPAFPEPGDSLQVPLVLFLGRHDLTTPSDLAVSYFERLHAPWSAVYWFDHSAHFPFFEEPERFHTLLLRVDSLRRAHQ